MPKKGKRSSTLGNKKKGWRPSGAPKIRKKQLRATPLVNYQDNGVIVVIGEEEDGGVLDMNRQMRLSICWMYEKDYDQGEELTKEIVEDLRERAKLGKRVNIKRILEDYRMHRAVGIQYEGNRIVDTKLGRKAILDVASEKGR